MRRTVAGVGVVVAVLLVPLADASHGEWSARTTDVPESAGTVVLALSKATPGRVVYRTHDGFCETWTDGNPLNLTYAQTVCQTPARASQDYEAVSGEVLFTEAGSKTIIIQILDDDIDEREETFSVEANEAESTPGGATRSIAVVNIRDDDDADGVESLAAPATTTTTTGRRPAAPSAAAATTVPSPGPTAPESLTGAAPITTDVKIEQVSGDLRPGPGFALGADDPAWLSAPEAGRRGATSPLTFGVAGAAAGAGAVGWIRRRRRWSSTRP